MYIPVKDFLKENIVKIFHDRMEASDYQMYDWWGNKQDRRSEHFGDWEMCLEYGRLLHMHGKRKDPSTVEDSGGAVTITVKIDFFSYCVDIKMSKEISSPSAEGLYPFHDYKVKSATFVLLDMRRDKERYIGTLHQEIPLLDGSEDLYPKDVFKNFLV